MMTRFLLAVTILSCALALAADAPENPSSLKPASANAAPIYVKLLFPDDPAAGATGSERPIVIGRVQPVIESWIANGIDENGRQATFRAVTAWVPLVEDPFESTHLWDGKLDGVHCSCMVGADITERKDGWIKISVRGWGPGGEEATVALQDEPGSREVVPVTQAKTKHGTPHVAIFIGVPVQ